MDPILQPVDDKLRNQAQAIALLQSAVDLQKSVTVFDNLEFLPWLLAPGASANTGSTGNLTIATQSVPTTTCAWFKTQPHGEYANAYWYVKNGPLPKAVTFKYELSLMFATSADAAASQAVELDIQQVIAGMVYNTGLQWNFQGNQLRVWNRQGKAWVATGNPCPRWTPGQWMRVVFETHRDDAKVYHDAVTMNGIRTSLGQSFSSVNLGLSDMLNCAVQLDGNQSATPYAIYRDATRFTAS